MFRLLFGAAMMRWLERFAEGPAAREGAPAGGERSPAAAGEIDAPGDADTAGAEPVARPKVERAAMGSRFEVYLAGTDAGALIGAGEQALDEVERLDRQLSHYRADSDISRLNVHAADQWVRLEPRLYGLLGRCREFSEATGGAFDVTTAPLVRAWGFHDGAPCVPDPADLERARAAAGMAHVQFDDDDNLVRFDGPGVEITLGAIGKGFAIDEAVEVLRFYHVGAAMIHGGQSTIYAHGAPPGADAWELTVRDPRDHETPIEVLRLRDEAISTSGNYEQFFDVDGVRYSHIIDPRTGVPALGTLSVSVVARGAAESDALSTALFVMSPDEREEFLRGRPDLRVIILSERGDGDVGVITYGLEP